jgi:hypothetical protein
VWGVFVSMKLRSSSPSTTSSELIDAVMDVYVTWRERCAAVEMSYRIWSCAVPEESALAYNGYTAALDREELAADEYRRLIDRAAASLAVRKL